MRKSCIPPTDSIGRTAIAITMMPTPPSHCSRARQIRIPGEAISICSSTVDPVVVIPDTDSKMASVKLSCSSLNMKGSEPNSPINIHDPLVRRKAWRRPRSNPSRCDVASHTDTPTKAVRRDDRAKTCQSGEPKYRSKHIGISIAAARMVVSRPRMFRTGERVMTRAPILASFFRLAVADHSRLTGKVTEKSGNRVFA